MVTREPNGSESYGPVLFICTSLVRVAEPNWSRQVREPVYKKSLFVPVWGRSHMGPLRVQGVKELVEK